MKQTLFLLLALFVTNISLFSQTKEEINKAIDNGDCETLYNFLQDTEGKEAGLVTSTKQALGRYTGTDAGVSKYRTRRMDARVNNVGKELTENLFENPQKYLPDVVARLTNGVADSFQKVKIIHDWICNNIAYDAQMYLGYSRYKSQDYVTVIKNKLAVCAGYAGLFNQMCTLAGIEAITISGYSKGHGYRGNIDYGPDHDWNAVKLNKKWYLVDVTWDAGYLYGKTFVKKYTTNYLFLDSRPFLYSHLPVQNKYQFFAPVLTKTQFVDEPFISGLFFRVGLSLKSDLPRYKNSIDGQFSFEIGLKNTNIDYSCKLRTLSDNNVDKGAWSTRKSNIVTLFYDVPDGNEYEGNLFARLKNELIIHEHINVYTFEQKIIPTLEKLVQYKSITEKQKNYFLNSYYKDESNVNHEVYHYLEDQFDSERINAVVKIHPLVGLQLDMLEHVLGFKIIAQKGYNGFNSVSKE